MCWPCRVRYTGTCARNCCYFSLWIAAHTTVRCPRSSTHPSVHGTGISPQHLTDTVRQLLQRNISRTTVSSSSRSTPTHESSALSPVESSSPPTRLLVLLSMFRVRPVSSRFCVHPSFLQTLTLCKLGLSPVLSSLRLSYPLRPRLSTPIQPVSPRRQNYG